LAYSVGFTITGEIQDVIGKVPAGGLDVGLLDLGGPARAAGTQAAASTGGQPSLISSVRLQK
jgi:hypothetical protein